MMAIGRKNNFLIQSEVVLLILKMFLIIDNTLK